MVLGILFGIQVVEIAEYRLFNLRSDPYERADVTSNTYYDWFMSDGADSSGLRPSHDNFWPCSRIFHRASGLRVLALINSSKKISAEFWI